MTDAQRKVAAKPVALRGTIRVDARGQWVHQIFAHLRCSNGDHGLSWSRGEETTRLYND
jgi:hypothetical protein